MAAIVDNFSDFDEVRTRLEKPAYLFHNEQKIFEYHSSLFLNFDVSFSDWVLAIRICVRLNLTILYRTSARSNL